MICIVCKRTSEECGCLIAIDRSNVKNRRWICAKCISSVYVEEIDPVIMNRLRLFNPNISSRLEHNKEDT